MTKDPINISTTKELENIVRSKTINVDVIISGQYIKSLGTIEKVNGCLGLINSALENLGNLRYIKSDFWINSYSISSKLFSLNKLEFVGGDMIMRYANLRDIGSIKKVGGKLSLRDTQIKDLGQLEYVGGDLFLPRRIKDIIDLSKITVKGKVKFWNDKKIKITSRDKELSLINYNGEIPYWSHKYIYSFYELRNANSEQSKFYYVFKEYFLDGKYIDVKGNDNYIFILYFDLINTYKSIKILKKYLEKLQINYPLTKSYIQDFLIEYFEKNDDYESSWKLILNKEYIGLGEIVEYENKLKYELLNSSFIIKLGGYSHLTNFGQKKIKNIKPYVDKTLDIYKNGRMFFNIFLKNGLPFKLKTSFFSSLIKDNIVFLQKKEVKNFYKYDQEFYKQFYLSSDEYEHYKSIDDSQINPYYQNPMPHVVEKAILNQFRVILKSAEDLYREDIGMPKVGEGWISETELFYKISNYFKDYEIISHASPKWLGRQHLDIYIPKLNIGIEYVSFP